MSRITMSLENDFAGRVLASFDLDAFANKIRAEVIEECAKVVSSMVGICQSSCPIDCEWGTEESCVESWKIYLTEQLKEQKK